jgi:preprotein translocase SecE subunit
VLRVEIQKDSDRSVELVRNPMELAKLPLATKTYVEELQAEMKRVTWPSWPQVRATTGVVIAAVFLFAAYFFVVNYGVNMAITKLIALFSK